MACNVQAILASSLQKFSGEAASADIEATPEFIAECKKIIEDNNFHQILFLT
jgi:hypothetical protein